MEKKRPIGRPKTFKTPSKLYECYQAYRQHLRDNPLKESVFVGKEGTERIKRHYKPPTWKGFEVFLFKMNVGNCKKSVRLDWYRTNYNNNYEDYQVIIHMIGAEMFDDKFAGAAVGMYQHNIIAREIGLAEATTIEVTPPTLDGGINMPPD